MRLAALALTAVLALALASSAQALTVAAPQLLSPTAQGAGPDDTDVEGVELTADGQRVFVQTFASLTADDGDGGKADVYELTNGTPVLVSKPTGVPDPNTANCFLKALSTDGSRVIFETQQKMTADDNDTARFDVYERAAGATTLISAPTGVADPDTGDASFDRATPDLSHVLFQSTQKMTADDGDSGREDVYLRTGGTTSLVSKPATGVTDPNTGDAFADRMTDDGSRIFFETDQKMTADDGDSAKTDVFERTGGNTTLVSKASGVPDPGTGDASLDDISADGTKAFFETTQKLTSDDGDSGLGDVYMRAGGTTTLISKTTGLADPGSFRVDFDSVSRDGTRVYLRTAQQMTADDLDSGRIDVFLRAGGTTTLLTKATGVPDPDGDDIGNFRVTDDGSRMLFQTRQNMTADDTDSGTRDDVYERSGGVTRLISGPDGVPDDDAGNVVLADASSDERRVLLETGNKLTSDDTDSGFSDLYVHTALGTRLVSKVASGSDPNSGHESGGTIAPDGSRAFFDTPEPLVGTDADAGKRDVYLATFSDPAPNTTITAGPGASTFDRTPTFKFTSNEPGSTFECRIDAGVFLPCASPRTLGPLAVGSHTFRVRATDVEGATDTSAAVRAFKVAAKVLFLGTKAADKLVGTSRNEKACGKGGNDTIAMRGGRDVLYGGRCGPRKPPPNARARAGAAIAAAAATDGDDKLSGGAGDDFLDGGSGKDTDNGGAGNDTIKAADGTKDTVNCGKGKDDRATVDKKDAVTGCEHVTRK